jgi:hypothetical protein
VLGLTRLSPLNVKKKKKSRRLEVPPCSVEEVRGLLHPPCGVLGRVLSFFLSVFLSFCRSKFMGLYMKFYSRPPVLAEPGLAPSTKTSVSSQPAQVMEKSVLVVSYFSIYISLSLSLHFWMKLFFLPYYGVSLCPRRSSLERTFMSRKPSTYVPTALLPLCHN